MMILRLLHWTFRLPTLPRGHDAGCRAGTQASDDEEAEIISCGETDAGPATFRAVPQSACNCTRKLELRPPTFYEAVTGISHT
jgi:hypothetical protein